MNLIPEGLRRRLVGNGALSARGEDHDPFPVVKLSAGASVWLLTELDPDDPDLAYGLCDLGLGTPKLDHVRLSDLARIAGDALVCDHDFVARQPLSGYLRDAKAAGAIVT